MKRPWLSVALSMFAIGWGANQFVSMIIAYRLHAGVSVGTAEILVGVYALGLIPALLIGGPLADRFGRSRVLRPSVLVSLVATSVLILGGHSVAALVLGRLLAGVASGGAFAAGTAWVKELSEPPWDRTATPGSGARRSAIFLSAGFGLGPVTAGLIAQWAPNPLVTAYLPHLVVILLVIPGLWQAPETWEASATPIGLLARLRVPTAGHPRFVAVVAPLAPAVFVAATVSFAVLPSVVSAHTGGLQVAFSALIAGITLSVGVGIQPFARRLDPYRMGGALGPQLGLTCVTGGLLIAALAAELTAPAVVIVAAAVLGAGYGLCLVSGLLEVQRIATGDDLAGLTAVYYALTYVGFAAPVILANLVHLASYPVLLLAAAAVLFTALVAVHVRAEQTAPVRR